MFQRGETGVTSRRDEQDRPKCGYHSITLLIAPAAIGTSDNDSAEKHLVAQQSLINVPLGELFDV